MILVLTAGSAIAVDWAKAKLPAILVAWYPGQRGGTAVADVLFGATNPAGRLPVTFYKADEKLPDFEDYSMKNRTYRYFEGAAAVSRSATASRTRSSTYSGLKLDKSSVGGGRHACRPRSPSGTSATRAGDEVVQLYLKPLDPKRSRALKELRGIERVDARSPANRAR